MTSAPTASKGLTQTLSQPAAALAVPRRILGSLITANIQTAAHAQQHHPEHRLNHT